jgi:dUTP pyrophosphatase
MKIVNKSNNPLPTYATEGSAGMDIRSNEVCNIPPLGRRLVKTGLYIQLPKRYEAQIRPRSGNALNKGLTVLNSPGTIDSDYRGEIGVILHNASNKNILIDKGDKIAQMVIAKYERFDFEVVEELDETERGAGGFGSTGEK